MAGVLSRLHGLGLVHRDVKPSNIVDVSTSGAPRHHDWRLIDIATHARQGEPHALSIVYLESEKVLLCTWLGDQIAWLQCATGAFVLMMVLPHSAGIHGL